MFVKKNSTAINRRDLKNKYFVNKERGKQTNLQAETHKKTSRIRKKLKGLKYDIKIIFQFT